MNILFFNMSEYSEWVTRGIPNRNRHVVFGVEKDEAVERVVLVDFMPFTLKRAARLWLRNIFRKNKGRVVYSTFFDSMVEVSEDVYVFSSIRSVLGEKSFYSALDAALKKIDFTADVLWSYFPYFVGYLDYFSSVKRVVFDAVDDWSEHENFKSVKSVLKENYAKIESRADIIFTVAEDLKNLFSKHSNVHWIPNGVDFEHFNTSKGSVPAILSKIEALPGAVVGYVGVIQNRIDFDLVAKIAQLHPSESFVFVGPVWPDAEIEKVKGLSNVHFFGAVSYSVLPLVISSFNVGIIPHKINAFTASMNPLKLYEYLAVGIPVVTTKIAGLDVFKDVVFTADFDTFSPLLIKALSEVNNYTLRKQRKDSAHRQSWDARVGDMMRFIKN